MRLPSQVVVLLGPPGSGKGTQGALLASLTGMPEVSTGEILRRECQSGSTLGSRIQTLLAAGQLVPDDLVNQVAAQRLGRRDCRNGCILDGYPRTASQALFLDALLDRLNLSQPTVLDFAIDSEEIVSRLSRRHHCARCGRIFSIDREVTPEFVCDLDGCELIRRADDNPAAIRERLRIHAANASEVVRHYQHKNYHRILATRPVDEISAELIGILDGALPPALTTESTRVPALV